MKHAVYAGSFDPPTLGHLALIEKALRLFDKVTVVVAVNPDKNYMFTALERVQLVQDMVKDLNVKVRFTDGTVGEVARRIKAKYFLRGLRDGKDLESELNLEFLNWKYFKDIMTVYVSSDPDRSGVSSSSLKWSMEIGTEEFVALHATKAVQKALREKIHGTTK